MNHSDVLKQNALPLPIPRSHLQTAQKFAKEQPNPKIAQRVYFNTLAVLAVNNYLQLMDVETRLEESDSWNPVVRMCADTADLIVQGLGRLECRSLSKTTSDRKSEQPLFVIPPEVCSDRIGYLAVEIDEDEKEALLLGFTPTPGTGEIYIQNLRSLDDFLDHLDDLAQPKVHLRQWFANVVEAGWQEVELLLGTSLEPPERDGGVAQKVKNALDTGVRGIETLLGNPNAQQLQFRGSSRSPQEGLFNQLLPEAEVMRAKLLDLGMQLKNQTVTLLVAINPEPDDKVNICVQVHPAGSQKYLPPRLTLALLQADSQVLQSVESRSQDLCIQLRPFTVWPGTDFKLRVAWDGVGIAETFAV